MYIQIFKRNFYDETRRKEFLDNFLIEEKDTEINYLCLKNRLKCGNYTVS